MKMIGIVDEFGTESFMPLQGNLNKILLLIIRSKINFQRSVIFYCLDFTNKEINKIQYLIGSNKVKSYNEAGIIITEKLDNSTKKDKLLNRFYRLKERL